MPGFNLPARAARAVGCDHHVGVGGQLQKFANGRGAVFSAGAAHQADAEDFQAAGEVGAVVMAADQRHGAHMPAGEHRERDGVVPDGVDESFGAVAGIRIRVRGADEIANAKRAEQQANHENNASGQDPIEPSAADFHEGAAFRVPHGTRYVAKAAY